ncbi:hypothetical protein VOLCADRAFT_121416 [Volvox carteri f. nagariensis]|uniref:G domain-containing protein n=1 Tax=Volvox carteri f. nagariensis TaxID=3068 RepID=D8U9M8_VOLCA|nr:uncharacterized protein VOLCADRAFT_121416 [Volvox carteri f. nagariensis]EFJ43669.1 hypothetical protein VOLCADRAFT_121416 [Volvox carteri f. nagariensis]|eukprot:XP_002955369.1 hypothetical protein VOLCADRAFT_121416 [Volvox carteri f. nagariensis]
MAKALKLMEQRIKMIDVLVEVRDARLPLSSANPDIARLAPRKRRLIVLNKIDLADHTATKAACTLLQSQGHVVVPCVATREGSAGRVLDAVLDWLQTQYSPACPPSASAPSSSSSSASHPDLSLMMVAGAPNTGKSALINALKRAAQKEGLLEGDQAFQRTARSGPLPGVTRQLGGFKVCRSPLLYVLDTPGVLPPALPDEGVAVRLALTGLMPGAVGGLTDDVLVRHLVQILVSEPRHQRQLWMAADGQVAAMARQRTAAAAAAARGSHDGGGAGSGGGWRRRESGSIALARALHDVVTMPAPPAPAWHPGMDGGDDNDDGEDNGGSFDAEHPYPLYDRERNNDDDGRMMRPGRRGGGGVPSARVDAERRVAALLRHLTRGRFVKELWGATPWTMWGRGTLYGDPMAQPHNRTKQNGAEGLLGSSTRQLINDV